MRNKNIMTISFLIFILLLNMTACGNSKTTFSGQQTDTQQQSEAVQSST